MKRPTKAGFYWVAGEFEAYVVEIDDSGMVFVSGEGTWITIDHFEEQYTDNWIAEAMCPEYPLPQLDYTEAEDHFARSGYYIHEWEMSKETQELLNQLRVFEEQSLPNIRINGPPYGEFPAFIGGVADCCKPCPNHPSNGGSGICHCTLPSMTVTYNVSE